MHKISLPIHFKVFVKLGKLAIKANFHPNIELQVKNVVS